MRGVQTCELKVIILIPVTQRELIQRSSIGKFQIGKVPVQYLPVPRTEVHRPICTHTYNGYQFSLPSPLLSRNLLVFHFINSRLQFLLLLQQVIMATKQSHQLSLTGLHYELSIFSTGEQKSSLSPSFVH